MQKMWRTTRVNKFIASNTFLLAVVLVLGTACGAQQGKEAKHTETTAMPDSIAVVPFEIEDGWGFKINKGTHTFIYQDIIPCIQGKSHFQSKEDAVKVGEQMAENIRKNPGSLPQITMEQLLEMKIAGVK